jgi:hypothetical protein
MDFDYAGALELAKRLGGCAENVLGHIRYRIDPNSKDLCITDMLYAALSPMGGPFFEKGGFFGHFCPPPQKCHFLTFLAIFWPFLGVQGGDPATPLFWPFLPIFGDPGGRGGQEGGGVGVGRGVLLISLLETLLLIGLPGDQPGKESPRSGDGSPGRDG